MAGDLCDLKRNYIQSFIISIFQLLQYNTLQISLRKLIDLKTHTKYSYLKVKYDIDTLT